MAPKSTISANGQALPGRIVMLLSAEELGGAANLLRQSRELVESVRILFRRQDAGCAVRLGDIMARLSDEREYVERLIAKPTNGSGKP
jgi:hypothetical protein